MKAHELAKKLLEMHDVEVATGNIYDEDDDIIFNSIRIVQEFEVEKSSSGNSFWNVTSRTHPNDIGKIIVLE